MEEELVGDLQRIGVDVLVRNASTGRWIVRLKLLMFGHPIDQSFLAIGITKKEALYKACSKLPKIIKTRLIENS